MIREFDIVWNNDDGLIVAKTIKYQLFKKSLILWEDKGFVVATDGDKVVSTMAFEGRSRFAIIRDRVCANGNGATTVLTKFV